MNENYLKKFRKKRENVEKYFEKLREVFLDVFPFLSEFFEIIFVQNDLILKIFPNKFWKFLKSISKISEVFLEVLWNLPKYVTKSFKFISKFFETILEIFWSCTTTRPPMGEFLSMMKYQYTSIGKPEHVTPDSRKHVPSDGALLVTPKLRPLTWTNRCLLRWQSYDTWTASKFYVH